MLDAFRLHGSMRCGAGLACESAFLVCLRLATKLESVGEQMNRSSQELATALKMQGSEQTSALMKVVSEITPAVETFKELKGAATGMLRATEKKRKSHSGN